MGLIVLALLLVGMYYSLKLILMSIGGVIDEASRRK